MTSSTSFNYCIPNFDGGGYGAGFKFNEHELFHAIQTLFQFKTIGYGFNFGSESSIALNRLNFHSMDGSNIGSKLDSLQNIELKSIHIDSGLIHVQLSRLKDQN